MEAVAVPLEVEAIKASAICLCRQIDYIVHYKRNAQYFASKLDDLSRKRYDIKGRVTEATKRRDTVRKVVEGWLKKVDKALSDGADLNKEATGIDSWFKGWCCGRYSIGKKASKEIVALIELLNEGEKFAEVSDPTPLQDMERMPTDDFEVFNSTRSAMDLVMEALKSDGKNIIGVHGMGGIGKKTLMRNIGNEVKKKGIFNVVVTVSVSQNPDLKKIQRDIAEELGVSLEYEKEDCRARKLHTILKREMSVLIILENMWKSLDLNEVGIPSGKDYPGCKVVLTTRRKDVCGSMRTQENVQLECLSEVDSWSLFKKNAGSGVDSPSLKEDATDVAKECKGLPVALVTLGKAMRHKEDPNTWKNVLQQLREFDFLSIEEMEPKVFIPIKLSYDYLLNDETKLVFLFFSLFPEDYKISMDELLCYMMGEGLFKDVNLILAKVKLQSVVDTLKSSHLLLKGDRDGVALMHDVIRDVSKIIATKDYGFIVRAGSGLEQGWPERGILEKCKRLSLMGNKLTYLPERPECPAILTLAMSGCQSLPNIPERFFKGMKSLLTLDLSNTPISSLPSSLPCLENLRTLNLDNCSKLQDSSLIWKLNKLEMISLKNTSIKNLPERPECPAILTLGMSGCQSLTNIPEHFFKGMKSLLTLDLSNTSISPLPSSLPCLVNLRTLSLENCSQLQDVSLILKLKKLEIINLKNTLMKLSEEEIQQFTNMKVSECCFS